MFWITLPASTLPSMTPDPQPSSTSVALLSAMPPDLVPRRSLPRTRILLAEDVLANQLITATLLRRQGHLVDIACSGKAAVEAVTPRNLRRLSADLG